MNNNWMAVTVDGIEYFGDRDSAVAWASNYMAECNDGLEWSDDVMSVLVATVTHRVTETLHETGVAEYALEEVSSGCRPAVPAAVDLTLARPGDVCGYSDGGLGLITQQVDRHDGFQWQSSYGVWHRRNGCSNGRGNGGSDIIAVYRDGRLICGTETEGENQ